ncbi:MAG: hypothetical protein HYZ21_07735 [Chloroflexi bacterium]|nr:hypothetical protein [Chloroflexota bacterium]
MKDQIPSAWIFNRLGRAFTPGSAGYWLSNILWLHIILAGSPFLLGLVLRETEKLISLWVGGMLATEGVIFAIVMSHFAVQSILDDTANKVVEKINNVGDLSKLLFWFKYTWSAPYILYFALPYCLLWALLGTVSNSAFIQEFTGFGFILWSILDGLLAGVVCHVYFWTCYLAFRMKTHQYEMNAFSPADSEIVNDISEMLTRTIYMLATISAYVTLVSTSKLVAPQNRAIFSFPILVIAWTIIIVQFLLTRSTLRAITNREKWKTLNRIQSKINALEAAGDLSDKDTAERLLRLADIHKQIMASKTSTFDLKSVSTLFSQLMLPLLGILLGNLDKLSTFLP